MAVVLLGMDALLDGKTAEQGERSYSKIDAKLASVFVATGFETMPKIPPSESWQEAGGMKEHSVSTENCKITIKTTTMDNDRNFMSVVVERNDKKGIHNVGLAKIALNILDGERVSAEVKIAESGFSGAVNLSEFTETGKRDMYVEDYNYLTPKESGKNGATSKTLETGDIRGKVVGLAKAMDNDPFRVAQLIIGNLVDNQSLVYVQPHLERKRSQAIWEQLMKVEPYRARLGSHFESIKEVGYTARGAHLFSGYEAAASVMEISKELKFSDETMRQLQEENLRLDNVDVSNRDSLMEHTVNISKRTSEGANVWLYKQIAQTGDITLAGSKDIVKLPNQTIDGLVKKLNVGSAEVSIGINNIKSEDLEKAYTVEFFECQPKSKTESGPTRVSFIEKRKYGETLGVAQIDLGDKKVKLYMLNKKGVLYKSSNLSADELAQIDSDVVRSFIAGKSIDDLKVKTIFEANKIIDGEAP